MQIRGFMAALTAVVLIAGCSAPRADGELIADPYEATNREIHQFNKEMDILILRPAAEAYDLVTPALVKHMVSNEVSHLQLPGMFVNRVLQGDAEEAVIVLTRFGLNTVLGAGGLLDPATEFGLPYQPTDFGVTLATWGIEEGVYQELPIFGPSTTRNTVGRVVDFVLDPVSLATGGGAAGFADGALINAPSALTISRTPVAVVSLRLENAAIFDQVFYQSDDSYIAARTGYVQSRRRLAAGGETEADELPNIFD